MLMKMENSKRSQIYRIIRQIMCNIYRFESLNEVICFRKAFLYLIKTCPKERLFYPADEDAIKDGMVRQLTLCLLITITVILSDFIS